MSAGLRGLQPMTLSLETAATDQHSGTTGGVARNPVAELAQISSEIFDARTGRVKVPGFYDDVAKAPLMNKCINFCPASRYDDRA